MEDVKIKPAKGTPFKFNIFHDTGFYQSLVASDLVKTYGMQVDRNRVKKIKAVDGGQMECSGSVAFQVTYEGEKTDVLALVTPALQDKVLLSWRMLQRLDVIPKEFPRRRRMNTMAQRFEVESRAVSSPKEISKEIPKETSKEIPGEIP